MSRRGDEKGLVCRASGERAVTPQCTAMRGFAINLSRGICHSSACPPPSPRRFQVRLSDVSVVLRRNDSSSARPTRASMARVSAFTKFFTPYCWTFAGMAKGLEDRTAKPRALYERMQREVWETWPSHTNSFVIGTAVINTHSLPLA